MCLLGMSFQAGPGLLSLPLWTSSILVHPILSFSVVLYHVTGLLPFTLTFKRL